MSLVFQPRSARLTALIAGIWLYSFGHALAQPAPASDSEERPTFDADQGALGDPQQEPKRAPERPPRTRNGAAKPETSAGSTGFVSSNTRRNKLKTSDGPKDPYGTRLAPGVIPGADAPALLSNGTTQPGEANPGTASAADNTTVRARASSAAAPETPVLNAADQSGATDIPQRPRKPAVEEDPFAPPGLRFGSFLWHGAVDVKAGYSSNPGWVPGGSGSAVVVVSPELSARSDWERHELDVTLRGSYSDYPELSSINRPNVDAKVDGRIDVTRESRVDLEGRFLLSTDYPGSPNLPADIAKLPIYTDVGATLGFGQQSGHFDVSIKGTFDRIAYEDSLLTDGSLFSNQDRDYQQYGTQLRAGYEITPVLKPFFGFDAYTRLHDLAVDRDGYARDSDGVEPMIGAKFDLPHLFTGEISIGYLQAVYKDPRLPDVSDLMINGSLAWVATGLTTVKLIATSLLTESTLAGVSAIVQRGGEIDVDHALRRWLILTGRFGASSWQYVGDIRQDWRYFASLALTYKVSRALQLSAELREDWMQSNVPAVDFSSTSFLVGIRLQK